MADYLATLADFIAEASFDDLPQDAVERGKLVLVDSIAAIAGGAAEPEMDALTRAMVAESPTGPATVIGPGLKTEAAKAAFLNGTAGTFLEMDEGNQFARGHPGIHVVPAVLAGDLIMIKGSLGSRMRVIVEALEALGAPRPQAANGR